MGKVVYFTMLFLFISAVAFGPIEFFFGRTIERAYGAAIDQPVLSDQELNQAVVWKLILCLAFATALIVWALQFTYSRELHSKSKLQTFLKDNFLTKWRSLRSRQDEAINGIKAVKQHPSAFFRPTFVRKLFRTLFVSTS
jgi:hypothetical protein